MTLLNISDWTQQVFIRVEERIYLQLVKWVRIWREKKGVYDREGHGKEEMSEVSTMIASVASSAITRINARNCPLKIFLNFNIVERLGIGQLILPRSTIPYSSISKIIWHLHFLKAKISLPFFWTAWTS